MKKENLTIVLSLTNKLISVNDLYKAGIKSTGYKKVPYIYKNPRANILEQEVRNQLRALNLEEHREWIKNCKSFSLSLQFIFKSWITRKDCSNHIKFLEDCLTRFIKEDLGIENYDDSKHVEVHSYKSVIPKAKDEYVCIKLCPSNFNVRFDEIEKPERFFLGGTTAGTNWREKVIPEIEKMGCTYFNPIVPDWTPECIEMENEEKENKCNAFLYILTPEMKGIYSVAEIIDSTWKCVNSGNGFVYFGILGDKEKWGDEMWRSLMAVLEMVKSIGEDSDKIKCGIINSPEECLKL